MVNLEEAAVICGKAYQYDADLELGIGISESEFLEFAQKKGASEDQLFSLRGAFLEGRMRDTQEFAEISCGRPILIPDDATEDTADKYRELQQKLDATCEMYQQRTRKLKQLCKGNVPF